MSVSVLLCLFAFAKVVFCAWPLPLDFACWWWQTCDRRNHRQVLEASGVLRCVDVRLCRWLQSVYAADEWPVTAYPWEGAVFGVVPTPCSGRLSRRP
jgi:hypothetical protein